MEHRTREDLDSALHTFAHPHAKGREARKQDEPRVLKELHIKQLHDGTFYHTLHHENGLREEGSTGDLDSVHDALEEHFGEPNAGEQEEHEEHRSNHGKD
jgi:hypothetical protein